MKLVEQMQLLCEWFFAPDYEFIANLGLKIIYQQRDGIKQSTKERMFLSGQNCVKALITNHFMKENSWSIISLILTP